MLNQKSLMMILWYPCLVMLCYTLDYLTLEIFEYSRIVSLIIHNVIWQGLHIINLLTEFIQLIWVSLIIFIFKYFISHIFVLLLIDFLLIRVFTNILIREIKQNHILAFCCYRVNLFQFSYYILNLKYFKNIQSYE